MNEAAIQRALVKHLRARARPGVWWAHIPNGGKRDARTGAIMKQLGARAGTPDMLFIYDGKVLFLELKTKAGSVSEVQQECICDILRAGANAIVVYGLDEALSVLHRWGIIR